MHTAIFILGTNPVFHNLVEEIGYHCNGTIVGRIKRPRLLPGHYTASVWFGDGESDFVEAHDVLSFQVEDGVNYLRMPSGNMGAAAVEAEWSISP